MKTSFLDYGIHQNINAPSALNLSLEYLPDPFTEGHVHGEDMRIDSDPEDLGARTIAYTLVYSCNWEFR